VAGSRWKLITLSNSDISILCENAKGVHLLFAQFAQATALFTLKEVREHYAKDSHNRSILVKPRLTFEF
jgi:hypothetical protein